MVERNDVSITRQSIRSIDERAASEKLEIIRTVEGSHRRIASVTGPEGNVLTAERRTGVREERENFGLSVRDERIIRSDFSLESGRDAADRILAMKERPTAIFCAADMVAFGLIARLKEGGVSVPDDISVVGFDDIEMSVSFIPALTTIRQDRQQIGRLAAKRLLQRMSDPSLENGVELVNVELVKRASTAAPPD